MDSGLALGFVKNNPWVQVDRQKRLMEKRHVAVAESEKYSAAQNRYENFLPTDVAGEFSGNYYDREICISQELEYGPGFVQKLRNRYLQLIATSSLNNSPTDLPLSANGLPYLDGSVEKSTFSNKYKYATRSASCDDLLSNGGPSPPQMKRNGGMAGGFYSKSPSSLSVFKMTQQNAPEKQDEFWEDQARGNFSNGFAPTAGSSTENVIAEMIPPVATLKGYFDPVHSKHASTPSASTNRPVKDQSVESSVSSDVKSLNENVPEFVRKAKQLKHVGPIRSESAQNVFSNIAPVEETAPEKIQPSVQIEPNSNVHSNGGIAHRMDTVDAVPVEGIFRTKETTNKESVTNSDLFPSLPSESFSLEKIQKTNDYYNNTAVLHKENQDNTPELVEMNVSGFKHKTPSSSVSKSPPVPPPAASLPSNANGQPPRIMSPIPDVSEMKEMILRLEEKRKLREAEEKQKANLVKPKPIVSTVLNFRTDENLKEFKVDKSHEPPEVKPLAVGRPLEVKPVVADKPLEVIPVVIDKPKSPNVVVAVPRESLSSQFKNKQLLNEVGDSKSTVNNTPPKVDYQTTSLLDMDYVDNSSIPSAAEVLKPTTDFSHLYSNGFEDPFLTKNQNPYYTVGTYGTNGYVDVANGNRNNWDDDEDDDDLTIELDEVDNKVVIYEFTNAYVRLPKSSLASNSSKNKPPVEFKEEATKAYAYVEEVEAEQTGWQQGLELNYKEYKELSDNLRHEKYKKVETHFDRSGHSHEKPEDQQQVLVSGNLAHYTPSHLKSTDYTLGSTFSENTDTKTVPDADVKNLNLANSHHGNSAMEDGLNSTFTNDSMNVLEDQENGGPWSSDNRDDLLF